MQHFRFSWTKMPIRVYVIFPARQNNDFGRNRPPISAVFGRNFGWKNLSIVPLLYTCLVVYVFHLFSAHFALVLSCRVPHQLTDFRSLLLAHGFLHSFTIKYSPTITSPQSPQPQPKIKILWFVLGTLINFVIHIALKRTKFIMVVMFMKLVNPPSSRQCNGFC